jgi:hypothetical protein
MIIGSLTAIHDQEADLLISSTRPSEMRLVNAVALIVSYPEGGTPEALTSSASPGRTSGLPQRIGLVPLLQEEAISRLGRACQKTLSCSP